MKKIILVSCFSIIFLGIANIASATSGACSYHGGVECSAGAAADGNAICNDGTESSVSYYSMDECQVSTVSDFCSSAFPTQETTDYVTATDDTVRQLIKSEINSDIQSANQALTYDEQQLNLLVQSDTSMWNATIQQDQQEQQSAAGTASAVMGQSGTAPWNSSNDQATLNNISTQYSSAIQNAQNDESVSIQQADAQFQPSINSASQCVSSLNRLSSTLNNYQPPVTTTPQQTVNTATANTIIQPASMTPAFQCPQGYTCSALTATASTTAGSMCPTFSSHLQIGSSGSDVTALQSWLVSKNLLVMPAGVALGSFGNLTKAAVIAYQTSVGLPATGYVGTMTIAKINAFCNTTQ